MLAPVQKENNVFMLGSWWSIYNYPILYDHGLFTKKRSLQDELAK